MKKIIDNNLIKELRRRTGVGIIKCKESLIQAHGDLELAIDNIRKFGLEIAEKKSCRIMSSGIVVTKISENKQRGVMIEVNCETDFVARENEFKEFVHSVAITALNENINDINVLKDVFKKQRAILIAKFGENIDIQRFAVLTGICIGCYTHIFKIGVLISVNSRVILTQLIKNITMHIVAKNPKFIHTNDVPKDVIMREYSIQKDIAKNLNKSKDVLEKIISGRMNRFFNEIVLTRQNFILDINKTIGELLNEHHIKIYNFIRFEIGNYNK